MGVLTGVLLAPMMAPVWGFRFVLEKLHEEAESVLHDEGRGFAELIELSMRRAAGELSEAEYAEQESALLERLNAIREQKDAMLRGGTDEDDEAGDDVESDETPEPIDVEPAVTEG